MHHWYARKLMITKYIAVEGIYFLIENMTSVRVTGTHDEEMILVMHNDYSFL